VVRGIYAALGVFFLALGILGIFVPLLPTTINVILAAFFLFRSNDRIYRWLLANPRFGPLLRDYRAGLGIPRRAKMIGVAAVTVTFAATIAVAVDATWARLALIALAAAIISYILTRPTTEAVLRSRRLSAEP
jgi:uncharacterized protein